MVTASARTALPISEAQHDGVAPSVLDLAQARFRRSVLEAFDKRASTHALIELSRIAHGWVCTSADPDIELPLVGLLAHPRLDPEVLFGPASSWLAHHPDLAPWADGDATSPKLAALEGRPLLLAVLSECLCSEPWLERLCIASRAALTEAPEGSYPQLRIALARQADRTEHAWPRSQVDERRAERARRRAELLLRLGSRGPPLEAALADVASFAPLHELEGTEELLSHPGDVWSPAFAALLDDTVRFPRDERELEGQLTELSTPTTEVGRRVAEQYEAHPYPRWSRAGTVASGPLSRQLGALFLRMRETLSDWPSRPKVLVAGAGTGAEPIRLALAHSECDVTGVDLSARSLAYATRKARAAGVSNLRLARADLQALPPEWSGFELIEAMGVLHHLESPADGLSALRARLAPHGLMKIGLYSRLGRRHLVAHRDTGGLTGGDANHLRGFRERVLAAEADDPLSALTDTRDFYSLSGLRDLCFHEHETCFDLVEVGELVESAGLELVGFVHHDPRVLRGFRALFPRAGEERSWTCWQAFEEANPDAFTSMYQFYVRISERPAESRPR